ncbi:RNA polymerase sigma factor [Pseudoalteromonas xiamenensis]
MLYKNNPFMSSIHFSSSSFGEEKEQTRTLVQCFIANQDALKGYFRRAVGEQADAEDLFQKLLLKALKAEPSSHIENPLAYGYRMARHLVIDHHNEQNKSPESLEHEPECDAQSLESMLEHEQRVQLYQRVLSEMSPLRREIFVRRRLHGETRVQIAQSLSLTDEAVKKHISRAMDTFKRAMQDSLDTCVGDLAR